MAIQVISTPMLKTDRDHPEDAYLSGLLKQSEGQKVTVRPEISGWLQELRQRAAYETAHQQIPTRQDEEWRFTDLAPLRELEFVRAASVPATHEMIEPFLLPESDRARVVFINGFYTPALSEVCALPEGVFVGHFADLPLEDSYEAIKYIGHHPGEKEVFNSLNTSGFHDLAVIWAKKNMVVSTPIHLLFLTLVEDRPIFSQPRGLIVAEKGASLNIVEHYGAIMRDCSDLPQQQPYFTNSVLEIFVEDNARVNHTRNQRESGDSFHIGKNAVFQARNSHYTCNAISLGAKLSRHNLEINQMGSQTETYLNGLTVIGREQTADTHSAINLNYAHGMADQLHKCIVDDRAHGIFSGKVLVPQTAQLTNASQLNRNLLLSSKARVDTKPQLQITADNVKCSHGATVSQIDAEELFYLQSRGLNADSARNLLLDAFAAEILDRIPVPSLRQRLQSCVACRHLW